MAASIASWRAGMRAVITPEQMADACQVLLRTAVDGDMQAMALLLRYGYEPPKDGPAHSVTGLDPDALSTLEGCRNAAMHILREQLNGNLPPEAAQALRHTVDLVIKTHLAESGARQTDAIEELVADYVMLEAGKEEESIAAILAARDAKRASDGA